MYGRVCYGYSLPHMLIVVIRYTIAIIHVALMTNLLCSCVLNFGYIFIFNIMNKILDETLFLATKIISVGTSLLVATIDIFWKVSGADELLLYIYSGRELQWHHLVFVGILEE